MATHPIFDTSSVIKYRSQLKPYFKVAYFPSLGSVDIRLLVGEAD